MAEPAPNTVVKGADRSERRKKPRKSATNLSLVTVEMDPNGFGLMLDVSEGGAGVQVMSRIEPGTNVQIAFKLPDVDSQIEGSGVITWCDGHGRVGVEFQQLNDQSSHQLKQWINSLPESFVQDNPAFSTLFRESSGEEQLRTIRAELVDLNLDTDATLQFVLEKIVDQTRSNGGAIALGEKDRMVCRASTGLAPDVGVVIGTGSALTAECIRTGKIVRCEDTEIDVRVDEEICRELNLRSSVIVPILYQGRMRGVLEVFSPVPNAFTDQHVNLMEHCAQFAADIACGSKPGIPAPVRAEAVVAEKKATIIATTEIKPAAEPAPAPPIKNVAVVPAASAKQTDSPLSSVISGRTAATPQPALEKLQLIKPIELIPASSFDPESILETKPAGTTWKVAVALVIAALVIVMAGLGWLYKTFASKSAVPNTTAPVAVAPATQPQPLPAPPVPATSSNTPPPDSNLPATTPKVTSQSSDKSIIADDVVQGRNVKASYRDQSPLVIMPGTKPAPRDEIPADAPSIVLGTNPAVSAINLPGSISRPELLKQGTVTGGRLLYRVEPEYPQLAKQQRLQGNIVLTARVLKDGRVDHIKRVSGSPLLENAAITAVRQWRYEPYKLNGQPQEVDISITVQFRLR